jgi:hypothetical protein
MECPWFRESPVHCCIIADSPPDREVYPNPALVFEMAEPLLATRDRLPNSVGCCISNGQEWADVYPVSGRAGICRPAR